MVMFCAESSVKYSLSFFTVSLISIVLLFCVLIVYLYPCSAHCAYSINK